MKRIAHVTNFKIFKMIRSYKIWIGVRLGVCAKGVKVYLVVNSYLEAKKRKNWWCCILTVSVYNEEAFNEQLLVKKSSKASE